MVKTIYVVIVIFVILIILLIALLLIRNLTKPQPQQQVSAQPVKIGLGPTIGTLTVETIGTQGPVQGSTAVFDPDQNLPSQYFLIEPSTSDPTIVTIRSNMNNNYIFPTFPSTPTATTLPTGFAFSQPTIPGPGDNQSSWFTLAQVPDQNLYSFQSLKYPTKYLTNGDDVTFRISPPYQDLIVVVSNSTYFFPAQMFTPLSLGSTLTNFILST